LTWLRLGFVRLTGLSGQKSIVAAGEFSGRACTVRGRGLGRTRVSYEEQGPRTKMSSHIFVLLG